MGGIRVGSTTSKPAKHTPVANVVPANTVEQVYKKRMDDLAKLHYQQGKKHNDDEAYDKAIEEYTACLNVDSALWKTPDKRSNVLCCKANALRIKSRYVEALADYDEAIRLNPQWVFTQSCRGLLLLTLGNIDEAERAFNAICEATTESVFNLVQKNNSEYERCASCLDEAKVIARARLAEVAELRLELSKIPALHAADNFEAVVECCNKVLKMLPHHRPTLVNRTDAKCELNKYDMCYFEIVDMHKRTHYTVLKLHAHERAVFPVDSSELVCWPSASNNERLCDSSAITQVLLCLGPRLAETFITVLKNITQSRFYGAKMKTGIYAALEELSLLLTDVDKTGKWSWVGAEYLKVQMLSVHDRAGYKEYTAKNWEGALLSYSEALKVDPSARVWNAMMHRNRAIIHRNLGKFTEALADCNCAVQLAPSWMQPLLYRARVHKALGRHDECIADYQRYLAFNPKPADHEEVLKEMLAYQKYQKPECKVCFDSYNRAEGLCCARECGTFTCWECLVQSYAMAARPDAIQGSSNTEGELLCSDIKCKCPIKLGDLTRGNASEEVHHARESFKVHVLTTKKVSEALRSQEDRIRAEYARIDGIKDVDARAAAKLHLKIVDEVLTLRCPRCKTAFMDFEGCFALQCGNGACRCGFCAWCLKDCGVDSHGHVKACPENRDGGYFNTELAFQQHHKVKRTAAVKALIEDGAVNANTKSKLRVLLSADLRDLQISAEDVFGAAPGVRAPAVHKPAPAPVPKPAAAPPMAEYHDEYADYVFDEDLVWD